MTATWSQARPAQGDVALFKSVPEDFRVDELAAFEPACEGEHLYLHIEKTDLSTPEVAAWLGACFGLPESAVGYAGMKDKRAVTTQWFSVHTPRDAGDLPQRSGITVLAASRHLRKLRRGELAGNRFRVRLRQVAGAAWPERLAAVRQCGVPNYYGPQRFGRDNLAQALRWLGEGGRRRQTPHRRRGGPPRRGPARDFRSGLHLSVLRSFLFNEVLARRVANDNWHCLIPGDVPAALPEVVASAGGADHTAAGAEPPPRQVPTGPLWGRGRSPASEEALVIEEQALSPHAAVRDGLEHAGLEQQRRRLVLTAGDLDWQLDGADLALRFTLPPGGYATTLLEAAFDLRTPGAPW